MSLATTVRWKAGIAVGIAAWALPLESQQSGDTLVAGVLADWPPYYALDAAGRPTGFAIELLEAVAERTGFAVRYQVYPTFPAVAAALQSGAVDIIPSMGVVVGRDMLFTSPVDVFHVAAFVRARSAGILRLGDVAGPVAVVESNIGVGLVTAGDSLEVVVLPNVREALFRLMAGEINALIYPAPVVWALARQRGIADELRELSPPIIEVRRALAVAPGNTGLRDRLDSAVSALVGTEEYQAIFTRWHQPPPAFWTVPRVALTAALAVALILVVALTARLRVLRQIRFQAELLDVIGEAVIATDTQGKVLFWNASAESLFGWPQRETVGRPVSDFTTPAGGEADAATIMQAVLGGTAWSGEFVLRRRDGSVFPGFVRLRPITSPSGAVVGVVGTSTDLSERRSLEEKLQQAQKMEGIGRLAGGVAHDFNNLLTVISGNTELVLGDMERDDTYRDALFQVRAAAARAASLTRQLLAFSRRQESAPTVLNPNTLVESVRGLLQRLIGEDVRLVVETGPDVGNVRADGIQLDQVLLNLVVNARDAMPLGGTLTIETANVELNADQATEESGATPGRYVLIAVSDTGVGMDEETQRRIFEPFFTTKPEGQGTGLGLATVYGIVRQHGGHIRVYSELGIGTTFKVYLPRVTESVATATTANASARGGTETILIVEDEESLRRLAERVLQMVGYRTLSAGSPAEALRVSAGHDGPIDLVLSDIVMPEMHGPELVARLLETRPETRALFMSGYAERSLAERGLGIPGAAVISKPFDIAELSRRVRMVLDANHK